MSNFYFISLKLSLTREINQDSGYNRMPLPYMYYDVTMQPNKVRHFVECSTF
jgi:hypothetical protein